MTPADIENHINKLKERGKELENALSAPDVYSDLTNFRRMSQELSKLDSQGECHPRQPVCDRVFFDEL